MRALIIGDEEKAAIATVIERAKNNVVSNEMIRAMIEGRIKPKEGHNDHYSVLIPVGYRVTYTRECALREHPEVVLHHISVAVDRRGKMPNVHAVQVILQEFGMPTDFSEMAHSYIEDTADGSKAINLLALVRENA